MALRPLSSWAGSGGGVCVGGSTSLPVVIISCSVMVTQYIPDVALYASYLSCLRSRKMKADQDFAVSPPIGQPVLHESSSYKLSFRHFMSLYSQFQLSLS